MTQTDSLELGKFDDRVIVFSRMASRFRMVQVDSRIVDKLAIYLKTGDADGLMGSLGISANTWAKLKKGEAIRESVAERLVRRANAIR